MSEDTPPSTRIAEAAIAELSPEAGIPARFCDKELKEWSIRIFGTLKAGGLAVAAG
jgi:hypothetical protein